MKQEEAKKKKEEPAVKDKKTNKTGKAKGPKALPLKIYLIALIEMLAAPCVCFLCIFLREGFSRYACFSAGAVLVTEAFALCVKISEYPKMPYGNSTHPVRNAICFFALCLIALSTGFLPEFAVPLSSACFIYMVLTSLKTGLSHALLFTTMAMCSLGEGSWFFIYYFLGTLILCYMYSRAEDFERMVLPACVFALYRVVLFVFICLSLNTGLTPQLIIAAAGGLIAELVVILIGVYRLRQDVVNRLKLKLSEICDPEYRLLKELREESREEFFRAVHTAYLCNLCAKKTGADTMLTRALGYFHRIGVLRGDNMNIAQKTLSIALENSFEPELVGLIREYWEISAHKLSKEASIAILCDDVVHTIMDRFTTSNNVNYNNIISETMEFYTQYKRFSISDLSLKDIGDIEKCLKGEKLYYDFLR